MNRNENLVSVIICTYNRRVKLERAIESALFQKDCDVEIIVVDDCSSDGTYKFLKNHYGNSIQTLSTGTNSGRAAGSNLGFRYAKGKFIALLDDDDYWIDPRKLKKQLDVMESNSSIGVLGTWWIDLFKENVELEKKPVAPENRYLMIERLLKTGGVVSGSTPIIARKAWESVNGMDVKQVRGIDSDLYRRIALAGYRVAVLPEITTVADCSHSIRMSNARRRNSLKMHIKANIYVLKKHWKHYFFFPRALLSRLISIISLTKRYFFSKEKG